MANDRLRALEEVENQIATILQCAGSSIPACNNNRKLCGYIEATSQDISQEVKVATGQPHEGSTYSARKDCQMGLNRAEYTRVKLGELGRTCKVMLDLQP
uniref:Mediator of RNA polymerase II transcription subunit 11 n=1 Tax=Hucho hucho TaxID=62062 RepID=A0A4W5REU6_9TELE